MSLWTSDPKDWPKSPIGEIDLKAFELDYANFELSEEQQRELEECLKPFNQQPRRLDLVLLD